MGVVYHFYVSQLRGMISLQLLLSLYNIQHISDLPLLSTEDFTEFILSAMQSPLTFHSLKALFILSYSYINNTDLVI